MVRVTGTTRLRVSEMMRMLTCQEDWGWKESNMRKVRMMRMIKMTRVARTMRLMILRMLTCQRWEESMTGKVR